MKCFVIPITIGVTGIVTEGQKLYLKTIPRKHSVDPLKKTAVVGTLHILRKVLQSEN